MQAAIDIQEAALEVHHTLAEVHQQQRMDYVLEVVLAGDTKGQADHSMEEVQAVPMVCHDVQSLAAEAHVKVVVCYSEVLQVPRVHAQQE